MPSPSKCDFDGGRGGRAGCATSNRHVNASASRPAQGSTSIRRQRRGDESPVDGSDSSLPTPGVGWQISAGRRVKWSGGRLVPGGGVSPGQLYPGKKRIIFLIFFHHRHRYYHRRHRYAKPPYNLWYFRGKHFRNTPLDLVDDNDIISVNMILEFQVTSQVAGNRGQLLGDRKVCCLIQRLVGIC